MSTTEFKASSLLSSGHQTFSLAQLIKVGDTDHAQVLVIRAYDRDVYSGQQSYDYGFFTSPNSGKISAGTQISPTTLYFDLKDGQYVSRDTGEALVDFNFVSSDQNYRSVYLSLFTNDTKNASYDSVWLDPHWTHLSDLNVVTRIDYVDPTPNSATPEEIAAIAKSFIGKVWNNEGCWLLTSNISAAAGASLPVASAKVDTDNISGNGQWQVVFNGGKQTGDWRALLQVGDVVELGYLNGKGHIATVTSGTGHLAMWVDNSGESAKDGTASDIIIQGEHSVEDWTSAANDHSVVIFRLSPSTTATPNQLLSTIAAPLVTGHNLSIQVDHSLPVASLFSIQDPNLAPTTLIQILDASGQSHILLNGAHNLASPEKQQLGAVVVTANELSKLNYLASAGPHALTITAFNGSAWGSANLTITGWIDPPPTVIGASISLHAQSQLFALSSCFTSSSANGKAITEYRFIDAQHTGQLVLSSAQINLANNAEAALGIYRVSAENLNGVNWKVLADTATVSVSVFDGTQWSDYADVTIAGLNEAPTVTPTARQTLTVGQAKPLSDFFTISDTDHDAIKLISIYDFYDNIQLNGAVDHCPFQHAYEVTLEDFAKITYTAPTTLGGLQGITVYAYDGTTWSSPNSITFTTSDPRPAVEAGSNSQVKLNQSIALADLFIAVDPKHQDIQQIQVQDPVGGGKINLNGVSNLASAAEQAQGISRFNASDLTKVSYQAGGEVSSETLNIAASNGSVWGANLVSVYTIDDSLPVVYASPAYLDVGQTVSLSELFTAYATAGRTPTRYLIKDPQGAGNILLNGAHNIANEAQAGSIVIDARELSLLQYRASDSAQIESLTISAFDGTNWGQANLSITSQNLGRPVVTGSSVTVHAGQTLTIQDLFSVSEAGNGKVAGFQITDTQHHVQLNGAENYYANEEYKGFYGIYPKELEKITYVAGDAGSETIYIEAGNNKGATSLGAAIHITILPNPVITPNTVSLSTGQTIAVRDLFNVSNPSHHDILQYKIIDPAGGGSVYLNGANNLATGEQQGVSIIAAKDLPLLTYIAAQGYAVDALTISAYDGESWGGDTVAVTSIDGTPPQIKSLLSQIELNATVGFNKLFSAESHTGLPITMYRITDPSGAGKLLLNGAHNLATSEQTAQQGISIIAAKDFGKLQYVGAETSGGETIKLEAFDGQAWGALSIRIDSVKSTPPTITNTKTFINTGASTPLGQLFSTTDPDGHAISYYIFQDTSQQIALNGARNLWSQQESNGFYWISAADITKLQFSASQNGVFHFNMIINDGFNYSTWTTQTVIVGKDQLVLPPTILASQSSVSLAQKIPLAQFFTVSDPLENAIVQYRIQDPTGGGQVLFNAAKDLASSAEHAQGIFVFSAEDLSKVQYQGGSSTSIEALHISAYDGVNWGSAEIAITSALLPPVVSAAKTEIEFGHQLPLSELFKVLSASGNAISQYKIQDPAQGGQLLLNGVHNYADATQLTQGISIISASDLTQVEYASATKKGSETLLISAFDGLTWGSANLAIATTDNRPPVIAQLTSNVDVGAIVTLNSLFSGVSASGRPILEYFIQDPTGGGILGLNSAKNLATASQTAQGIVAVSAFDLPNMLYTGASTPGIEALTVTAFDGLNSSTTEICLNSVSPALPVVTTKPITLHLGDRVSLADLFSISNPNQHPIKWYFVLDADLGIELNGAANLAESPYYDYHGHYDFNNDADWHKILYVASHLGTVKIGMQIDDGFHVSQYVEEIITIVAAPTMVHSGDVYV